MAVPKKIRTVARSSAKKLAAPKVSPEALPVAAAPLPMLKGIVDEINNGTVRGWAVFASETTKRVMVEISVDGTVVSLATADQSRPDVMLAGFGDGQHGFTARLPALLLDGREHSVSVVEAITRLPLQGGVTQVLLPAESPTLQHFDMQDAYKLFDSDHYQSQAGLQNEPLAHYMAKGWKEGYNPHPLFHTRFYIFSNDLQGSQDPLSHFLSIGRWRQYKTHPLFDLEHYTKHRPDILASGQHPLLHYLKYGWQENISPSPFFDDTFYETQCSNLQSSGFSPLLHYLRFGWREKRRPHPDFDPDLFQRLTSVPSDEDPFTWFVMSLGRNQGDPVDTQAVVQKGNIDVSYLILNLGKPVMTLQCLHVLRSNTDLRRSEIIIVDNGSTPQSFALLCRHMGVARLIRLDVNRGFGEANNIGAEIAQGQILAFLNNDAFVTRGWLTPLLQALETDLTAGAAGPRFVFPDGRLQEAGALVMPCGSVVQRGRGLDGSFRLFDRAGPQRVDYTSAALILIRAQAFRAVLGFDMCWDPAYYEDVDLCLKLRLIGQHTIYVPASEVVHVENSTSSDRQLALQLGNVVAANRTKFVTRWSRHLTGEVGSEHDLIPLRPAAPNPPYTGLPRLALYTPFQLTPGGGERYLLSIAAVVRGVFDPVLLLPERYSRIRLATMARELSLDLDHLRIARIDTAALEGPFDVFVAMSNELLPPIPPLGRFNLHCCQFPFPMEDAHYAHHWDRYAGYDAQIVYSQFTARCVLNGVRRLGLQDKPIHVLSPPVPQVARVAQINSARQNNCWQDSDENPAIILNVGRFTPGGHAKRQDVMIEAFRRLVARSSRPMELHLAGALGNDSNAREHLATLQRSANGLSVTFHVNVLPGQIHDLYRSADVYWHLTGIGADPVKSPELFEHFGITIGEAMSAGCVPVVLRHGGPAEIITDGWNGYLIDSVDELIDRTMTVLARERRAEEAAVATRAIARAAEFAPDVFAQRLLQIVRAA